MRNRKIWESANRPLFVRSVWNEACGGYRHFILDFQPQRRLSESNYKPRSGAFKPSYSYEEPEHHEDFLQLVGSVKPQNRPNPNIKIPKPASNNRKILNSPPRTFLDFLRKRGATIKEESLSKRSSLQDLNAENNSGSDEKLAERVLNWLDLAGKTPLLRPNTAPDLSLKKPSPIIKEKDHVEQQVRTTTAAIRRPDSVKHITIIFNKEGIPIRYNRPIRYTDLFRIGFNASRRFASTLTASKLRRVEVNGETVVSSLPGNTAFDKATLDLKRPKGKTSSVRRHFENDYRTLINKKILEESCNLHEMKKQLHIFMPSLPKKTALVPADCASSMLSGAQSEQSKS